MSCNVRENGFLKESKHLRTHNIHKLRSGARGKRDVKKRKKETEEDPLLLSRSNKLGLCSKTYQTEEDFVTFTLTARCPETHQISG